MQYFVCVYILIVGHPIEDIKLLHDAHVTVCKMLFNVTYQVCILQSGAAKQVRKFFLMRSLINNMYNQDVHPDLASFLTKSWFQAGASTSQNCSHYSLHDV